MYQPLNQLEAKSLFMRLFGAKNASEVKKVIDKDEFLSDSYNWKPFNGNIQNFASFQNQSADPLSALVEKQNNQYDAILEKMCIQRGIDPTSPLAPTSVKDAVKTFFGVDVTSWHEVNTETLRELAESVQIIADGDKNTPNLTFYDDGIGQAPFNFERSFLSINAGNKAKKRFVQGKFNMGGLGSQEFCGGGRYQLIASKSAIDSDSDFGFTLVRFHELTPEEEAEHRSPWYEYFAPGDEIAHFAIDTLDLQLENRLFKTGTVIKLYSYELTDGMGGDFLDKFYKELNQAMFMPPMPLLLSERRYKPRRMKKGEHTAVFLGNHNRIQLNKKDLEETFSFTLQVEPYGELKITGFIFDERVKYTEYGNNIPIILTLNGQSQGTKERAFISQELGFKYLRDSLIVHVDCSDSRRNYDIFMGSRDRTKRNRTMLELWDKLTASLKNEKILQDVNLSRLDKRSPATSENRLTLDKIWKSVAVSERLTNLLKQGGYGLALQMKGNAQPNVSSSPAPSRLKRHSSVVPLSEGEGSKAKKSIPLGGSGSFHFHPENSLWKTADDIDFQVKLIQHRNQFGEPVEREENGEIIDFNEREIRPEELFDIKKKADGELLKVQLQTKKEALSIGDEVILSAELSFDGETYSSIMEVKIGTPAQSKPRKKKELAQPSTPELLTVYENEEQGDANWSDYGWNEEDVVQINVDNEGLVRSIAVNMDSRALMNQLLEKKHNDSNLDELKFLYMTNIYFNSLYMYLSLLNTKSSEENFDVEERVSQMFKSTFGDFLTSYNANSLFEV